MLSFDECIAYDSFNYPLNHTLFSLSVDGHVVDSEFIAFDRFALESCPSAVPSASCSSFSRASI